MNLLASSMFRFAMVFAAITIYFGCSSRDFQKVQERAHCLDFPQDCVTVVKNCDDPEVLKQDPDCQSGVYDYFNYTIEIPRDKADILFVIDNSGSMSFEQREMANRFNGFLNVISRLDYRIGIITTDVSASPDNDPRPINGNGAFQDGNLIEFVNYSNQKSGHTFLTPDISNRVDLFQNTIQRRETAVCEQSLKAGNSTINTCPSGDERAIYSLNLFLDNDGLTREGAPLSVIIVSDENERSSGTMSGMYALQDYDYPATFINRFNEKYQNSKLLKVHSIVTDNSTCASIQSNQGYGVMGYVGTYYKTLSNLTKGIIGTVCATDYTGQLTSIGQEILKDVPITNIACQNPVDFKITNLPAGVTYRIEGKKVYFDGQVSPGSTIQMSYGCLRN